jgi:hypothetical protein
MLLSCQSTLRKVIFLQMKKFLNYIDTLNCEQKVMICMAINNHNSLMGLGRLRDYDFLPMLIVTGTSKTFQRISHNLFLSDKNNCNLG